MSHTRTHQRSLRWSLLLAFVFVLATGLTAHADPLSEQLAEVESLQSKADTLTDELSALEGRYQLFVEAIEELKSHSDGIVGDLGLKRTLRDARAVAEELNAKAADLAALRKSQELAQAKVIALCDEQIAAKEESLFTASSEQQAELIASLQKLQTLRDRIRRSSVDPLLPVALPDLVGFDSNDPEEVLAAADELEDNKEKLAAQLDELDGMIASLERRKKLRSYAEDSADEANLFAEDVRPTRIGTTPTAGKAADAPTKSSTGGIATAGGTAPGTPSPGKSTDDWSAGTPAESPPPSGDPDAQSPSYNDATGAFNGGADSDGARDTTVSGGYDGLEPTLPDVAPHETAPINIGPPVSVPAVGVVRSEADLTALTGTGYGRDSAKSVDGELARLKKHRKTLEKSLSDLSKQRDLLRSKADSLGVELH
ncbi:MAG: hypothetical protein COW42_13165 [Deltaproteobacteria bacterium CG17_big_fil_post_rev_8_21_14_2_50_63_7]|nr:MAG: hypothetical protein COW42_13165 [Deltaproteobacteria bacterium CG17_big_fil_post_rev_8_21_14_2_50_63_7]